MKQLKPKWIRFAMSFAISSFDDANMDAEALYDMMVNLKPEKIKPLFELYDVFIWDSFQSFGHEELLDLITSMAEQAQETEERN